MRKATMVIGKAAKRILAATVAVAAIVSGALLTVARPASAVTWKYTMHTDDGDPGGVIKFQPNGDYVQVCDIEADGHGAWAVVYLNGDPYYNLYAGSNGSCDSTNANSDNLPEGKTITFKVCLTGYPAPTPTRYCDDAAWYNG